MHEVKQRCYQERRFDNYSVETYTTETDVGEIVFKYSTTIFYP